MNDLLSSARSLRPLVEAEADATDRELTMTSPVIEALAESGLNHLQVPKELGGLEADVDTTLDVLEELAHQDGSIGWVYMANANATAMCSMFDPDVARQMLEGRPDVVCAGQFVSRGKARRADGRLPGPGTVPVRQRDRSRDLDRRRRARAGRRRHTRSSTTPGCPRCWPSSCRATASRSRATGT